MTAASQTGRTAGPAAAIAAALSVMVLTGLGTYFRDVPIVSVDEVGYLGIARYFATGIGPNLEHTVYYHFGASLVWTPLSALSSDPETVYRLGIAVTAMMCGLTPVLLLGIARELALPRSMATVAATVIVSLWPSYFLHAHLLWAETTFRLVFLALLLATLSAGRTGRLVPVIAVAVLAVTAYAVHPRALAVLPLAVVFLFALSLAAKVRWSFAATAALIVIAGYAATEAVNAHLQDALWGANPTDAERISALWSRVTSIDGVWQYAWRLAGQAWYQICASLGLVLTGVVTGVRLYRSAGDLGTRAAIAFAGAATAGIAVAAAAQLTMATRLDHLVYGRYLDGATIILVWLGVLALLKIEWRGFAARWMLVGPPVALAGGLLVLFLDRASGLKPVGETNVAGIYPALAVLADHLPVNQALFAGVPALAVVAACCILATCRLRAAMLVLLALYAGAGDWLITKAIRSKTEIQQVRLAVAARIYSASGAETIHADRSARTPGTFFDQQMLHTSPFLWTDLRNDVLPHGAHVLLRSPAERYVVGTCLGQFSDTRLLYRIGPPGPSCRLR